MATEVMTGPATRLYGGSGHAMVSMRRIRDAGHSLRVAELLSLICLSLPCEILLFSSLPPP